MARKRGENPQGLLGDLCNAACSPVRLKILQVLYEEVEMGYGELARSIGVSEHLLNHHLKRLEGLVEKGERGYRLTWRGRMVVEIVRGLGALKPSIPPGPTLSGRLIAKRLAAYLIDIVVFFVATGAIIDPQLYKSLAMLAGALAALSLDLALEALKALVDRSLVGYSSVFLAAFTFLTLMEGYRGQSIGKALLGLRVVRADGGKIGLVEAGIRVAGKIFLLPVDLALGAPYWSRGYLRFTEYYTRTIVVEEKPLLRVLGGRFPNKGDSGGAVVEGGVSGRAPQRLS